MPLHVGTVTFVFLIPFVPSSASVKQQDEYTVYKSWNELRYRSTANFLENKFQVIFQPLSPTRGSNNI